jgi:hypothetical protein
VASEAECDLLTRQIQEMPVFITPFLVPSWSRNYHEFMTSSVLLKSSADELVAAFKLSLVLSNHSRQSLI